MMGQAKQRGSAEQRAEQAKQRSDNLKPTGSVKHFDEEMLSLMGLDEQSLPSHLVARLRDVRNIWILIDGDDRTFAEIVNMCFDVGIDMSPATVTEAMRNKESATFADVERYNELILNAGIDDFLRYACEELMTRAIEFEKLVDQYENRDGGRMRAAEESGFLTFGPVLTPKLCKSFAAELESIRQLSESVTKVPTSIEVVQLVALVAGLKALRNSTDQHRKTRFRDMFNGAGTSIEEIGAELLMHGIPVIKGGLDNETEWNSS